MLVNRSTRQFDMNIKTCLVFLAAMAAYFFVASVYAAPPSADKVTVATAGDMLQRISDQFPNLHALVTAVGYVIGFYLVIMGILKLKHMGESRTMMSQEHSIKSPLIYIFVGAALIYLPTAVSVGITTFWTDANPYGYKDVSDKYAPILTACFTAVKLFGAIAFIRGLLILSHLAGQSQQGTLAKALTHLIGGIFCINIDVFVKVILATIGVTISGFNS